MRKQYSFIIFHGFQFLLLAFLVLSCNQNKKITENTVKTLKIKLSSGIDSLSPFNPRYTDFLLVSYEKKYPRYYSQMMNRYKNVPNYDSLLIVSYSFQKEIFYYDLYKNNGLISQTHLKQASRYFKKFDTTNLSINFNYQINAATWFKNNKQYVVVDTDNNFDFGNDKIMIFDKDFRFKNNINPNSKLIDTLPMLNFKHQVSYNSKIVDVERKIQVFPYPNYYLTQLIKDKKVKKSALLLRLKDRLEGHLSKDKIGYTVFAQGFILPRMAFIFKPDSIDKMHDIVNYQYKFKDTISLYDELYKFDSIGNDLTEIYLTKIKPYKHFFSYRMGYVMKDFMVQNLEKKQMRISEILTNKKYILLDFWGTWCAPCKELTPELKKMNDELGNSIQIIGIAYDKDLDQVRKYIYNNNMNWDHLYSKDRKGIINELRITSFPTFILINQNREIIFRGIGKFSLDEIKKTIYKSK